MSAPIGEVRVEVRGDTSKVDPDIEKGLKRAAADADDDLNRIGKDFGKTLGVSMEKELGKHGPEISDAISKGTLNHPAVLSWDLDTDRNTIQRSVSRLGRDIEREVRALSAGGGGRGPFGAIGGAIADAVGAGFNISGRSSLIAFLIPLVGFIAELIVGLVQAVGALSAALFVVPSLIGSIILQVGVLFVAFQGLGTAIQGAFAAKNADELKKALEGLTPSAQQFVKTLLPLKDTFKAIRDIVQEQFFENFGNSITVLNKRLGPLLEANLGTVAAALGGLARTIVTFFGDPAFTQFLRYLIPATVNWIKELEPALSKFLFGLVSIGTAVTPFLKWIGSSLTSSLASLGDWLSRLSSDPDFLNWLNDAKETFGQLGKVIDSVALFVFNLVKAVDKAGGDETLGEIAVQIGAIAEFLGSPEGVKAIEGLIHAIVFLAQSFTILLLGILVVSAALESFFEWLVDVVAPAIGNAGKAIIDFFAGIIEAISKLFTDVGARASLWISDFMAGVATLRDTIGARFNEIKDTVVATVVGWASTIRDFFVTLPDRARSFIGNLVDTLFRAGQNLIQGLINGALSMLNPLGGAMSFIAAKAKEYFPHSPAESGPLSGSGDPLYAGQEIVKRLITGIQMETPALASTVNNAASTVVFGPNSIQIGFNGALPTQSQANMTGSAVGNGIAEILGARNTRLAIRTL